MRALLLLPILLVACSDAADPGTSTPTDAAADTITAAIDSAKPPTDASPETAVEDTARPPTDTGADSAGAFCGGIAGIMCPGGYYCFQATGACMTPDAGGTCAPIPTGCTKELNPVCGCDGKTYSNPCMASMAGVNVNTPGACAAGTGCASCSSSDWCDYAAVGACSGDGVCRVRPGACPGIYDPVCGCNGMTYSNSCAAHAAGVDDAAKGACP